MLASMLGQRSRRWPNLEPTLGQRIVFGGWRCVSRQGAGLPPFFRQHCGHCASSIVCGPATTPDDMKSQKLANTRRSPNVGSMLERRRRRRAKIDPALGERLVFSGKALQYLLTSA